MGFIQSFHGFEFDQDTIFDEQIGNVIAHHDMIIPDLNWMLLLNFQPGLPQFVSQGVLIYLF